MEIRQKFALQGFNNGKNSAQSVVMAYANEFGMDTNEVMKASGKLGSMEPSQQSCGAVNGAHMILELYVATKTADEGEQKALVREIFHTFRERFIQENKSDQCAELINTDLHSSEGKLLYKQLELREKVCSKCVSSAIEILDELIPV